MSHPHEPGRGKDNGRPSGHRYQGVHIGGAAHLGDTINYELENPLNRLPYATDAPYNSYHRQHEPTCLDNTRVDVLREIHNWAGEQDDRFIFWLNGLAGTGKSTIARTVAHTYNEQKRLGASFFFSRGGGDVSHASKFITSIAVQLASIAPTLQRYICDAISEDNNIASKGLRDQWNRLIFRPLSQLIAGSVPSSFVIVIDALDECEGERDIRSILQLLAEIKSLGATRLRIFLTSRPETPVRLGFRRMPGIIHHDLVLHDVSRAAVDHDIAIFLRDKFREMREEFEYLPAGWPGDDKIERLVQRADGLFIYAATVCRFINGAGQWSQQNLLDIVLPDAGLGQSLEWAYDVPSKSPTWELDEIYTQILQRSLNEVQDGRDKDRLLQTLKLVVGSFALLAEPLSAATLTNLLQIPPETVNLRVRHLHSVLNIPQSQDHPIRLLHPSFRDFLVNEDRCSDPNFWVDEKQAHRTLAESCIQLMSASLKQDICRLDASGALVADIESSRVKHSVPLELQYACLYWIQHLQKSGAQLHDNDQVHQFLQEHLLHWLEALSWMQKISEGILAMASLESIALTSECPRLYALIHDLKRFALSGRPAIEQTPLQVYYSALVFAPANSIVRQHFADRIPCWIQRLPDVQKNWGAALQTLEGHTAEVSAVAFSPDGKQLASAGETVRLWDTATGAALQTLEGHTAYISAIAFSPDGKRLASASYDDTVRLWDAATGAALQMLEGHTSYINAVAFSPDGKRLASASGDDTVRFWDAVTGAALQILEGHTAYMNAVGFSPDGKRLASASGDETVRLWDATLRTLMGYMGWVNAVAFSPDGKRLALVLYDKTVQLWDAATGAVLQTLEGHTADVNAVAFSPDGKQLASAAADKTVRLWDAATSAAPQTPKGHTSHINAVAFSPDGKQLALATDDETVRLWDVATGALLQTLEGHTGYVNAVAFSLDSKRLASASGDETVRLWDVVTGAALQTLEGHTGYVNAVAFSPDGKQLASAADETVRLWDVATGALLQTLEGYSTDPSDVFSLDGSCLSNQSTPITNIFVEDQWIAGGGDTFLWLPIEYRSTVTAVHKNTIAIGCNSGRVLILEFKI